MTLSRKGFLITKDGVVGNLIFTSETARDLYWSVNKSSLIQNDSYCFATVNGVLTLFQWTGETSPATYDNSNWILGLRRVQKERGTMIRTGGLDTTLTDINTRYKVIGTFVASTVNKNWTVSTDGKLTYIGEGDVFDAFGVSDAESSKVGKVNFVLYRNGVELPTTTTPHGFSTAQSSETLALIDDLFVNKNDYFEVYAYSPNTAGIVLTPNTLKVKFVN